MGVLTRRAAGLRSTCGSATVPLQILALLGGTAGAQVPVIFKVSEGVRPNAVVSLYGEFLAGTPNVRFIASDGSVAAVQGAVQTDPGGHFCRVVFPAIPPGAYRLSVRSGLEWSTQEVYVNRADPRWISEERAYPGLPLKLIGRNLDAWEYNGRRHTSVRLTPKGKGRSVVIAPDAVNPYCVDFTIPEGVPFGDYHVEVNAGSAEYGGDWIRLNRHSEFPGSVSDTVVHVEGPPTDPTARALQVAWVNDFPWDRVVNARIASGAKGDGTTDDTRALQEALDHVASQGGGVVFLPRGVYKGSSPKRVGKNRG
jgi:hypothetical protein